MKRDIGQALRILQVVEHHADLNGMALPHLFSELPGRHNEWTDSMTYNLALLVEAGYLTKSLATQDEPAILQLTWAGHELIEKLMR